MNIVLCPLSFCLFFHRSCCRYLRKYLRSANISVNIFTYISAIKTAIIRGAKNTANIYGYIGATLKSPPIFAQIFAVKKAKIYAPQIFAQLFTIILAQRSKYRTYWRKYLRRKKAKIYAPQIFAQLFTGKKAKKPMAPYLGEGVKKENFFLGLCPKLWVGGGQKS